MGVRLGRARFVPAPAAGGQLAAGVRAGAGTVGFLGNQGALVTMSSGTAPAGTSWDAGEGALTVTGSTVVLDGFVINGDIVHTAGALTVRNCVLHGIPFSGIDSTGASLRVEDTTIIGPGALVGGLKPVAAINGNVMTVIRCDLSGFGDGIQCGGASLISQCYIHAPATVGDLHCDGVQYQGGGTGITIEHCRIDMSSPGGEAAIDNGSGGGQNAAVAISDDNPPMVNPTINNCYLMGGVYYLRLEAGTSGATVTNNDFGPITSGGLDEVDVEGGGSAVSTWSNNRTSAGVLIPSP